MKIINTVQALREALDNTTKSVAFIPTMGALHEGHLSIINEGKKVAEVTVVSIFVNPTQFNQKSDLDKYPRTLEKDAALLEGQEVDFLFAPAESEIYPEGLDTKVDVDFGELVKVMEGAFRPGHFTGVAQVVKRLLDIVQPQFLIMGQKDFQQFTIIQHMINILRIPTELVVCKIMREENGLAMSSRNERLSISTRKKAGIILKVLESISRRAETRDINFLKDYAARKLNDPPFKLEYIEFVNGRTLQPINYYQQCEYVVVCLALWADEVRLIDNIILKK